MNTFIFMVLLFWMYVEHLSMHIPLLEQRLWDYYLHRGRLKGRLICYPEQVISEPSPLWSLVLTHLFITGCRQKEREMVGKDRRAFQMSISSTNWWWIQCLGSSQWLREEKLNLVALLSSWACFPQWSSDSCFCWYAVILGIFLALPSS